MTLHWTLPKQHAQPSGRELTLLLVVMCSALALVIGATSSLSIALPDLARDLGASQAELTWIVNAYSLVFAAALLPAGIAADRFGRRLALLCGLSVFGVASIASSLPTDPLLVATTRAVAGLGAAGVFPATLSVLVDSFPPERRAQAVAVWAGVSGGAATLGTFIGGGMLEVSGWGAIQVVFGVLAIALIPFVVRYVATGRNPGLDLDPVGGLLAVIGMGGLVLGIIESGDKSLTDPVALTGLVVGVTGIAAFIAWELRVDDPMLDVRLFGNPGLAAGSLLILLQTFAAFGFFFLAPQYLQIVKGYSAIQTALAFLPITVGVAMVTPFAPRIVGTVGARWAGATGMALVTPAFVLLGLLSPAAGFWPFALALVLFGAGFGLALTPGTTLIIDGLPADRRTLGSAVNDITREVGGALGGAVLGAVLIAVYQSSIADALRGLPARAAEQASAGIAEATAVAARLGPGGDAVLASARDSYADAYQIALFAAAGCTALAGILCAILAPSGATTIADPLALSTDATA